MTHLTPDEKRAIGWLTRKGWPAADIARSLNRPRQTIASYLRRAMPEYKARKLHQPETRRTILCPACQERLRFRTNGDGLALEECGCGYHATLRV